MSNKENLLGFLSLIKNPEIRDFTSRLLDVVPEVFWTARASKSHHPEDERGPEGNVIHAERVTKLVRIMAEGTQLTSDEVDCLTSAAILHDGCRYDLDGKAEYTVENHPSLIRKLASNHSIDCSYTSDIFVLIERHMGRWGDPVYWPDITASAIMHVADVISARAEQVWPIGETIKSDWVGATPFKEIGMNEEKMGLLKELAGDNDYWSSASRFIEQVSSRKLSSLTDRQRDWLSNIEASLSDELNKREGVKAFEGRDELEPEDIPF